MERAYHRPIGEKRERRHSLLGPALIFGLKELPKPEPLLTVVGDHALVPGRVPHYIHAGFPTPGTSSNRSRSCAAMAGPMPQPIAVRVILTSTWLRDEGRGTDLTS